LRLVLAVQNMEASGTIAKSQEIEFKALEGSLSMMSKGQSVQFPVLCAYHLRLSVERRAGLVSMFKSPIGLPHPNYLPHFQQSYG
jgi:hypothetical protein